MSLKQIGEFGFIRRISGGCVIRQDGVVRAIGDDAAAFRPEPDRLTLVTADLLVERVHFLRERISGTELGHKSLAVNLSDIAAMGGTAREAIVSLAIPENCPLSFLDDFYAGMKALAAVHRVNILGGDTTGAKADLAINITVIGSVAEKEMLLRSGARVGDRICVTGRLGDSRAGLQMLLDGVQADVEPWAALRRAHVRPEPHLKEGRFLAESGRVSAAIDVSDGLSSDAGHIAEESGVGLRLFAEQVPVSDNLKAYCKRFDAGDPVLWALSGGEDYCLLCTVAADAADEVCARFQQTFGRPLHSIGTVVEPGRMEVIGADGQAVPLEKTGWDHFG
ncbi:MAG: thiamine-phosphate kinase [Desulfobacterales bacterium]|jgi:thiamine-monophosphate kinase